MEVRALWRLDDDELLEQLVRFETESRERHGGALVVLGELLRRGVSTTKGYPSPSRLLQDTLRLGRAEANRMLAHAEAVTPARTISGQELPPPLPATAEAITEGALGDDHLTTIVRAIHELPPWLTPGERGAVERALVDAARITDAPAVARLGRELRARLDQDGRPPPDAELRRPANELRWIIRSNGSMLFRGRLDAEGAAWFTSVLSPLAKPRPAEQGVPDPRTRPERYGDALADAMRIAAGNGRLPDEGGERPTLVVTVPLASLRDGREPAVMDGVGPVDARIARRLACDSHVVPAVLGSGSEPLDIGRRSRVVPTGIRRALVLRDQGCAFPGCGAPHRWCDSHHVIAWADGGATAVDNLALLCGTHHRLVHHSEWEIRLRPKGRPEFIPPAYVDPRRRPRTNPILRS